MIKCHSPRLLVPLLAFLFLTPALAGGQVNLFVGQKDLDLGLAPDEDFLSPLEDQTEYGILFAFEGEDWPIALAIDVLLTPGEDVSASYSYYGYSVSGKIELETRELNAGVRKYFGDRFQGYVGGGLAYIEAEVTASLTVNAPGIPNLPSVSESQSESELGYWLNGGILYRIGERVNIGLDLRYSDASVDIDTESLDIGGLHYGAFVGFRWGE